ncbi:glycosyltransferase [uncultured Microscilla sp.]|uniref:glycosyltransferase family 2 protein n=1 Tax=uncultured Microscilla sp. TaxID=432653 RepID=UPI0026073D17|nr:glycosyltransferase [uncultured Microscilla sp.]
MATLAPITLFVYNRPRHTQKVLQSLQKNALSQESVLYVFADAPKTDATQAQVNKVRQIVKQTHWCKEVILIERGENFGLAKNIIDGVTKVVQQHGKVIVLEDDIVTSPGFLAYMNQALDLYANEPKVMQVSGHVPPVRMSKQLPDTFFFKKTSCWGWGTWVSDWATLNLDAQYLLGRIRELGQTAAFNIDNSYDFIEHLEANITGRLNTWAIKWQASVFLEGGLCLYPKKSLTRNIGFDNSGEHCTYSELHLNQPTAASVTVNKIRLEESAEARKKIVAFNHKQRQPTSFLQRVKNKLKIFRK